VRGERLDSTLNAVRKTQGFIGKQDGRGMLSEKIIKKVGQFFTN
jgi:hypothetical protein